MADLFLRPDLKTAGGEVSDIMFKGRYVGTLLLVYREKDRICGSVQLEKESLSSKDKKAVIRYVTNHIQSTIHALKAQECDVLVTYSKYDQVIATDAYRTEMTEDGLISEDEPEVIWVHEDGELGDWDIMEQDSMEMELDPEELENRYSDDVDEPDNDYRNPVYYELVSTKESTGKMEYHVYDKDQEWIAEVFLRIVGPNVIGDIHWMFNPLDEEIEHVTDLVVSDFDPEVIDTFTIDHRYEGEIIETVELTHEDLLDDGERSISGTADELEEYTVVLARDDTDMLTYEIYKQSEGGLPIGTATVDISRKQLSGFIDFRRKLEEPGEREKVATLVMQELDKEKDYDTISFTMLHQNRPIDEIIFENEPVH
jgi:hypothetical protein